VKINGCFGMFSITLLLTGLMTGLISAEAPEHGKIEPSRPIRVLRPLKLPATLPAERTALGPGYKPSMARLPDGELVMIFFTSEKIAGYHEFSKFSRSTDNGKTWSVPVRVKLGPGKTCSAARIG